MKEDSQFFFFLSMKIIFISSIVVVGRSKDNKVDLLNKDIGGKPIAELLRIGGVIWRLRP